jgi:hypothetical protein
VYGQGWMCVLEWTADGVRNVILIEEADMRHNFNEREESRRDEGNIHVCGKESLLLIYEVY